MPDLQILKKTPLPAVDWTKIGCVQTRLIGRNMTGRDKFFRQQRITMDRHALVRRPCADWVNRIGPRSEPAKPPQTGVRLPDAWIDFLGGACFESKKRTSLPKRGALGFQGLPLVIRVEKWSRFAVSR